MSLTKNIYSLGVSRLIGRTNVDTEELSKAKTNVFQTLLMWCKPTDRMAIQKIIGKVDLPINRSKALFEIADHMEKTGNIELAHAVREAARPFDLRLTLKRISELIISNYLDKDAAKDIIEKLHHLPEKYERYYDRAEFTNELTIDLREIAQDQHFGILDKRVKQEPSLVNDPKVSVQTNSEGVCCLEITKFENPNLTVGGERVALQRVKYALDQIRLSNPKAVIIDLRGNDGGSPYMMAFIASHFIKPGVLLGEFQYRNPIEKEELKYFPVDPCRTLSEEEIPLKERMLEQAIYILTSDYTLSAAESLTYNLKEHRNATIIGETTRGGAHLNKLFEVNTDFDLEIPFGDYVLANGMRNWEGRGITPDIKVNSKDALKVAEKEFD